MKILLFGAGENARRFIRCNPASEKVQIVGIVDNVRERWGEIFEQTYTIEPPENIKSKEWDKIAVTPASFGIIEEQLTTKYGIEKHRIIRASDLILPDRSNLGSIQLNCDSSNCFEVNDLIPDKIVFINKLEEFYFKKPHRVMNKWWHYFEVYHTFFQKYINRDVKILEIGVYKGGSLQMWKDYFGEKAVVIGVDIDTDCKKFEEKNIHICIGSQADRDFLVKVSEQWGPFDIVLDDGSHEVAHQILTFETLFPLLNEDGVFLCEDCHSSYSARYGGEFRKKDTFIEYSKNFADCVNSQFVNLDKIKSLPSYADSIKACHYYDSMVVVEKKHRGYSFFTEFGQKGQDEKCGI